MTLGTELTVSNIISASTLIALVTAILKGASAWANLKATQATQTGALKDIKATLGNGAPGTVVRTNVCEALHAGVRSDLTAVREDIRSLHDAVREMHRDG